jgi:hypothetical protein
MVFDTLYVVFISFKKAHNKNYRLVHVKIKQLFFVSLLYLPIELLSRHPFRLPNASLPQVTAQWENGSGTSTIVNRYVRYYPMFSFHTAHFTPYLLPNNAISFRSDPAQTVDGTKLAAMIEEGLREIVSKKINIKKEKKFGDFIVLQDKNFNYRQSCGLLVLAFKDYPFVVKLFMEKPTTILNFHATGLEPTFFFYMGGGSNRHLSGLTRLDNREFIAQRITQFQEWTDYLELPRKWFWLPHQQKNIVLSGTNIGGISHVRTEIPSTYAIVADKIDFSQETDRLSATKKREIIMNLCNDLNLNIDPHAKNFAFIEDAAKKIKIILVDTEHFPTMVGITKRKQFKDHNEWYIFLSGKCFSDIYLSSKRDLFLAGEESVRLHRSIDPGKSMII